MLCRKRGGKIVSDILRYTVEPGQKFTRFLLTPVDIEKVEVPNMTMDSEISRVEGIFEVEYPVRTQFLAMNDLTKVQLDQKNYSEIYTPFERDRVNKTTFISTPHKLSCRAKTIIKIEEAGIYSFRIRTCGGVKIFVNGNPEVIFDPYTRNHYSEKNITLPLISGKNELVVYFEDLAERDVSFYFELINDNAFSMDCELLLGTDLADYQELEMMLTEMNLSQDIFREGVIKLNLGKQDRSRSHKLRVRINPRLSLVNDGAQDGNITDFEVDDIHLEIPAKAKVIEIGNVVDIPTAGFTRMELGVQLENGQWLTRTLTCSIYNAKKFAQIIGGEDIRERKQEALDYFSTLDLEDINVALVKAYLNQLKDTNIYQDYLSAFRLIEEKGDCADFILAPLLAVYSQCRDNFPDDFHDQMKKITTGFRYWIDEPGNDVMWYFSENHALLFHVSQYLAGNLYPDELFQVSGRLGREQNEIGKQRLEEWFDYFFRVGFSEWNSTTYFPIDFIGFFSLYLSAPDESIRQRAKEALDYTFKLIAVNYHGGTMASTFGRVYEHNLKAMQLGEISSVIEIAWKKGYFNNSLRASALFALTDYEPPQELVECLCTDPNQALQAEYRQGDNKAYTYLYKTNAYSIASAINYQATQRGHQQHIMNLSLGETVMIWVNNPGEAEYSGGNRPSFWAGNDCLPYVSQYENVQFAHFNLSDTDYQYIHLYLPEWDLDEIRKVDNWIFVRKEKSYGAFFFTNPFSIAEDGAIAHREVRVYGDNQYVMIKASSEDEYGSFEKFITDLTTNSVTFADNKLVLEDPQHGVFQYDDVLLLNGDPVSYEAGYQIKYDIKTIKGENK